MSNYIEKLSNDKHTILGVSFAWGKRKGLDVFSELAKMLPEDKFQIVLVGTDDKVDKLIPQNVISVHRTNNQKELAELYTRADVFVMPTREENFPTVSIESIACGTPVVTFNTGGSPEMLNDISGIVVPVDDVSGMKEAILQCCDGNIMGTQDEIRAHAMNYDMNKKFIEYLDLYQQMLSSKK